MDLVAELAKKTFANLIRSRGSALKSVWTVQNTILGVPNSLIKLHNVTWNMNCQYSSIWLTNYVTVYVTVIT